MKQQYKAPAARKAWLKSYDLVQQLKDKPCMDCGNKFPSCAMQFDHRPGVSKSFDISQRGTRSTKAILEEIAKCDLVCACCHAVRTENRRIR